jgi:RNA polymerase sigma-70 factor, ECF subfamily
MVDADVEALVFEDFFRDEYPRLVPMLHALTGDRHRAEDLAQEALLRAQRDWRRIAAYDRPGAWVRRVALNAASNAGRRRGRERRALARIGTADEYAAEVPAGDEELWRAVRELPEHQRWAVVLHYVEDRPVAEVAFVLECSEGAVKTHLSRARATLARRLESQTRAPTRASERQRVSGQQRPAWPGNANDFRRR